MSGTCFFGDSAFYSAAAEEHKLFCSFATVKINHTLYYWSRAVPIFAYNNIGGEKYETVKREDKHNH